MVQLSWAISHPFAYIYAVLFLLVWFMGAQFGLIALGIVPKSLQKWSSLAALAALWTLLEWSRLFLFSGLSLNPAGIALTGSLYSLQMASLGGVFFLSFWVMLTNLAVLRVWLLGFRLIDSILIGFLVLFPYLFGFFHYHHHEHLLEKNKATFSVLLIQPGLPIEEDMDFQSAEEARRFVLHEWKVILGTAVKQLEEKVDLIVLPEYVVPYGTFHPVFSIKSIEKLFTDLFGPYAKTAFPPLKEPLAAYIETSKGPKWLVSNAFISQALANVFRADVVIGFEDSVYLDRDEQQRASYSSAFHFKPGFQPPVRYEKQVLLPMGEYIPFEWCKNLAAKYGIAGSFTPGTEAKIFNGIVPFGASICYEETFGDLMRGSRLKGAELLVNLTNDGWYPHSRLPQQHFDHARLRTVENGIPLVRACNTGLTGACDSLGRIIGLLDPDDSEGLHTSDSIRLDIPTYHYATLYTHVGDAFILLFCGFILLFWMVRNRIWIK
jgi:apolipoprotein N-acyltransferase